MSCADPERPKNDKATILGDSVQVVKELRAEVKRLKTEHESLMDEQRDVSNLLWLSLATLPVVKHLHSVKLQQGSIKMCDIFVMVDDCIPPL